MKKMIFPVMIAMLVFMSACSQTPQPNPCPLNMINPNSCELGTFTTKVNGCTTTQCRPSSDFGCKDLNIGDSFYDGCNTCSCAEDGARCTEKACPPKDRIKGLGEMCGGIAGFQCEEGLICKMEGDYPDAAGTCVNTTKDCPLVSQPAPGFCPNGTITPNYDESKTCITGYSCK